MINSLLSISNGAPCCRLVVQKSELFCFVVRNKLLQISIPPYCPSEETLLLPIAKVAVQDESHCLFLLNYSKTVRPFDCAKVAVFLPCYKE